MATVFINGRFVDPAEATLSAFDAGLQHGVGLFDTMLAGIGPDGSAWLLHADEHLARLTNSAQELGLTSALSPGGLREAVEETARRSAAGGTGQFRVRVTVTGGDLNLLAAARGAGPPGAQRPHQPTIMMAAQPAMSYPPDMFERGVAVTIADARANPLNPMEGHKTLNYWWRLRELAAAGRKGAAEAIVLQATNHLCGGCVSNVVLVKGSEAWTPIARGEEGEGDAVGPRGPARRPGAHLPSPVLPGIVRGWALARLASRGLTVKKRMLGISDLLDADEVLLTNSSWGVLPVVKVEREAIGDGVVGASARALIESWNTLLERGGADGQRL